MAPPLRLSFAVFAALALTVSPRPAAAQTNPEQARAILAERDRLFMLAAMAYADLSPADQPGTAALIELSAPDLNRAPEFFLARGYDRPADVQNAEINAIHLAGGAKWNAGVPDDASETKVHDSYAGLFAGATLYTTLEPFPESGTAATMVKISVSYYCLQNPRQRDAAEPHPLLPGFSGEYEFFGRKMTEEPLDIPSCAAAGKLLWDAAADPSFSLADYLQMQRERVFLRAHEAFESSLAEYPQNRGLLQCLKEAVDAPSDGAISTAATRKGCDKDAP